MKTANDFLGNAFESSIDQDFSVEQKQAAQSFIFEFLKPKPSPFPLIRLGGDGDGAYLVPDCLASIDACFSPGVANRKDFEDELYHKYGTRSHMCDFTSDLDSLRTALFPGQTFQKLWLDIEGDNSIRLEEWVDKVEPYSSSLMIQMDIEGAEYRNITNTPIDCLSKFKVCLIEIHGLSGLEDSMVLKEIMLPFFAKLSSSFFCVHVHPNNCAPDFHMPLLDLKMPRVLEVTLLSTDYLGSSSKTCSPLIPNPLDVVNVRHQPPLFLSGKWVSHADEPFGSELLKANQLLRYYQDPENFTLVKSSNQSIQWVIEWSSKPQRLLMTQSISVPSDDNSALGKLCQISESYYSNQPEQFMLSESSSAFIFHTAFANDQMFTIDLREPRTISSITLTNRLDTCQERARTLFMSFSLRKPEGGLPDPASSFLVSVPDSFLSKPALPHMVDCQMMAARYVLIFSPIATALHFSSIHISTQNEK